MKSALVVALLLVPSFALAQSFGDLSSEGAPDPVSLTLSPQYPQPYSTAVLTVDSTTLNLANSTLTVSVGGKQVYSGNVQPLAVTIGAPGALTTIKAVVTSQGASYPETLSVRPGDVSLVEEPIASVPPLYPGKPLVPAGGEVRLVAVTDFRTASGAAVNPNSLSYTWMQGEDTLTSSSGIGKSAIIVPTPLQYRAGDYSVIVETQDGSEVGAGDVSLAADDPIVRVYTSDPLLGIEFDHALGGSYTLTAPEAAFYAAPYSFSLADGAPAVTWFLNGDTAQSGSSITLRPTGSGSGTASLSVTAAEPQYYENASASLSLSYGSSGSSLFGL